MYKIDPKVVIISNPPNCATFIPFKYSISVLLKIEKKIEAKEKKLECPVCFKVAACPIFCYDDQHII